MELQHLASFTADEDDKSGYPMKSSYIQENEGLISNSNVNWFTFVASLPTSSAHGQSYIESKDPALVQYWTAVIILALFALVSFIVIISTWKKIRPFSRPSIPIIRRQNSRTNDISLTTTEDAFHASDIIKSHPIDPNEFPSVN